MWRSQAGAGDGLRADSSGVSVLQLLQRPRSVRRGLRKHLHRGLRISVQERGRALPPRCIALRGGRAGGERCAALHCAAGQIIAADARAA
jgi:hypothetical protein